MRKNIFMLLIATTIVLFIVLNNSIFLSKKEAMVIAEKKIISSLSPKALRQRPFNAESKWNGWNIKGDFNCESLETNNIKKICTGGAIEVFVNKFSKEVTILNHGR